MLKWRPELITNDQKINYEYGTATIFGQRVHPPFALRKLPEAFGFGQPNRGTPNTLTLRKSSITRALYTTSYYGVDEMRGGDKRDFLAWYERQKSESFDNRHVLEAYSG